MKLGICLSASSTKLIFRHIPATLWRRRARLASEGELIWQSPSHDRVHPRIESRDRQVSDLQCDALIAAGVDTPVAGAGLLIESFARGSVPCMPAVNLADCGREAC